jgi:hypothetical protein
MVEKKVVMVILGGINAHNFKEEAESTCKRPQDTAYECDYIDNLLVAHKLIIDSQYVDNKMRLWIS